MTAVAHALPTLPCAADTLAASRLLALTGVNLARAELDRIAMQTDAPDWRDVDAADYLDAAHALLAGKVRP